MHLSTHEKGLCSFALPSTSPAVSIIVSFTHAPYTILPPFYYHPFRLLILQTLLIYMFPPAFPCFVYVWHFASRRSRFAYFLSIYHYPLSSTPHLHSLLLPLSLALCFSSKQPALLRVAPSAISICKNISPPSYLLTNADLMGVGAAFSGYCRPLGWRTSR